MSPRMVGFLPLDFLPCCFQTPELLTVGSLEILALVAFLVGWVVFFLLGFELEAGLAS